MPTSTNIYIFFKYVHGANDQIEWPSERFSPVPVTLFSLFQFYWNNVCACVCVWSSKWRVYIDGKKRVDFLPSATNYRTNECLSLTECLFLMCGDVFHCVCGNLYMLVLIMFIDEHVLRLVHA